MGKELCCTAIKTISKVSFKMVFGMARANITLKLRGRYRRALGKMTSKKEQESLSGQMGFNGKAIGRKIKAQERAATPIIERQHRLDSASEN
jgi:hypothetical protein